MWYLLLLSIDQDRLTLPAYPDGYIVLFRGYYIIMAERDPEGNLINCKPQSDRFTAEADALTAFESM
jgi:hypothetical protein